MTRDEFNLQRLKDDLTSNRRVFPILVASVVLFVIFSIYALATGKSPAGIGSILIMASIALQLPLIKRKIDTYGDAISEYERHIADPSIPLSESTKAAIATSDFPAIELLKGWIALAVVAVMLIGMGILLGFIAEDETILVVLSVGSIIGGIIVFLPTLRMYRSWKVAKALEEAGL